MSACAPKWAQPYTASGQIRSSVVIAGDTGYFGTSDQKLYAINLDTGQLKWNPVILVGPILSSPTVQGDTLYVATHGYNMYALNTADGSRKWCFDQQTAAACAAQ